MVKGRVDIQGGLLINYIMLTAHSVPGSVLKADIQTPRTFWSVPEGTHSLVGKVERAVGVGSRATRWICRWAEGQGAFLEGA